MWSESKGIISTEKASIVKAPCSPPVDCTGGMRSRLLFGFRFAREGGQDSFARLCQAHVLEERESGASPPAPMQSGCVNRSIEKAPSCSC